MTTNSKLVFIDIDGTLADENHVVPESARIACKQAQANGHKLFICIGRSVPKIERSILDLGFDGVVSVAGAQANIGDRLLFQHLVPLGIFRQRYLLRYLSADFTELLTDLCLLGLSLFGVGGSVRW